MPVRRSPASRTIQFPNSWRFDLTESSANTYTEQSVDTNLSAERGVIGLIDEIIIQRDIMPTSLDEIELQLLINSGQTDILDLDHSQVIWMQHWRFGTFTDAGRHLDETVSRWEFYNPIPFVNPTITLGIKGTSLAAAGRIRMLVNYRVQKVTQNDYLKLLASLTR